MLYQLSYTPAWVTRPYSGADILASGQGHATNGARHDMVPSMHASPSHKPAAPIIPPEILLLAYRAGMFPMADAREDREVFWVEPKKRAILPLEGFHCSRSLAKVLRSDRFRVTLDANFAGVIDACALPRPDHPETWISHRIEESYLSLHRLGHAHSVECWLDGALAGGLYGVAFDRVFCGESMFSRAPNASKVALAWLVALLRHAGFRVLDCQFVTEHLASMGAVEISRDRYLGMLADAAAQPPAMGLGAAYVSLVGADGSGAGAAVADGAGRGAARGGGASPSESSDLTASSSPGKRIAQSLTHTS